MRTFKQFVRDAHEEAAERHGIPIAEAKRELPESIYWTNWREHIVESFDAGQEIPTRLWRQMDDGLKYRVLRTTRALRDNELTHKLKRKS